MNSNNNSLLNKLPNSAEQWCDIIFLCCLAFSAWYLQNTFIPNRSGIGLELPFNNLIYCCLTLSIGVMIIKCWLAQQVTLTRFNGVIAVFIMLLILPFAFNTFDHASDNYRLWALAFGLSYMLALQQLSYSYWQSSILLIIIIAGVIQLGHGINQHYFFFINDVFTDPNIISNKLVGSFQQVNVLASFFAFCSAVMLYAYAKYANWRVSWFLLVFLYIGLAAHCVVLNADTGRFNFLVSVTLASLFFAARYRRWELAIIAVMTITLCLQSRVDHLFLFNTHYLPYIDLPAPIGLTDADKLLFALPDRWLDVLGARPSIYYVAWEAFWTAPLTGHGLGSYFYTHQMTQASVYQDTNHLWFTFKPSFNMGHPHNELLYWMVESGICALIAFGLLIWQCAKLVVQDWRKLLPYVLIGLPLIIHSLLEYPFYTSALHYVAFIWVLVMLGQQQQRRQFPIKRIILIPISLLFIITLSYLLPLFKQTYDTQIAIAQQPYTTRAPVDLLFDIKQPGALSDWYAQELYFTNFYHINVDAEPPKAMVTAFIDFAERHRQRYPFKSIYEKLLFTYQIHGYEREYLALAEEYEMLFFEPFVQLDAEDKSNNPPVTEPVIDSITHSINN